MARPTLESQIARHRQLVHASANWRHNDKRDEQWKRFVDLYRGKQVSTKNKAEHRMVVNMIKSTIDVIAPSVSVSNPSFLVAPRKPEGGYTARVTEHVLNYIWRSYKYQRDFRLAVLDSLIIGHGWVKVGYKATKPPQLEKADDSMSDTDDEAYGVDDRDETLPGNVESETITEWDEDRPFAERVSPWDVFVDPHARRPADMTWIAQLIRRPVKDVKVDKRYEKKAREAVAGSQKAAYTNSFSKDARDSGDEPSESITEFVDVIEFYDIKRKTVCTFAWNGPDEDGYLIKPKQVEYPFSHPFVMLRNYEIPDHFYPMGEVESIEVLQEELNETRSQMLNHRQKFARKYLFHLDSFDQAGLDALKSDKDNEMVPFDGDINDMGSAVLAMPVQGTPPDFYNQSELIQDDINTISGVSEFMRGTAADIRRTATEAAMMQDAQNARASAKLEAVESSLAEIGERLVQLMQTFMTGEHVVRIVGAPGGKAWVKFDKDYIQGQYDFEVDAGSTQPRNESFRQQQALQLMDAITPLGEYINPEYLLRHVLTAFGVKDPSPFIAQPDPMQPPGAAEGAPGGAPPQGGPMPPQGAPMPPEGPPGPSGGEQGLPTQEAILAQIAGKTGLDLPS